MRRATIPLLLAALIALLAIVAWWALNDPAAIDGGGPSPPVRTKNAAPPPQPRRAAKPGGASSASDDPIAESEADDAPQDPDAIGAIVGHVIDVDGAPVAGATVRAAPRPESLVLERARFQPEIDTSYPRAFTVETRTAADGSFRIEGRSDRRWLVVAETPTTAADGVVVEPGEDDDLVLVLEPALDRAVAVRSRDGAPVPGAVALAYDPSYASAPHARFVADESGVLHLRCADDDPLLVRAPGFATARVLVSSELREIVLAPGLPIAGRVEDAAGNAVVGAVVVVTHFRAPHEAALTDAQGRFGFDGLDGEEAFRGFDVRVEADAFPVARKRVWAGDDDARFVMLRPARIEGVVVGEDGKPVAGVRVQSGGNATSSSSNGRFVVTDVAPGRAEVWADAPQELSARATVDVAEGATATVRLSLRPRAVSYLAVRVREADGANASAARVVVSLSGAFVQDATVWNAPAKFVLPCAPGTRVHVSAESFAARPTSDVEADVETSADAASPAQVLTIPRGVMVTFRVFDADGTEISDVSWISLRSAGERNWVGTGDGSAAVDPNRRIEVQVTGPGRSLTRFDLDPPGESGRTYDLRLVQGGTVRGRVVWADGTRPFGVVGRLTQSGALSSECVIDADGAFVATGVPPGRAALTIHRRDEAHGREVQIGSADLSVQSGGVCDVGAIPLWGATTLTGRVMGPGDRPVAGALVIVRGDGAQFAAQTVTDRDGRFTVEVLSGPKLIVTTVRPGVSGDARALGVVSAATKPLDIRLARPGSVRVSFQDASWASTGTIQASCGDGPTFLPPGGEFDRAAGPIRVVDGLPEGKVRLTLHLPDALPIARDVVVRPGETVDARFERAR